MESELFLDSPSTVSSGKSELSSRTGLRCRVRTRLPSSHADIKGEFSVYLYEEYAEPPQRIKQHLAIVFGDGFSSRSLEKRHSATETERDRLIRGAQPHPPNSSISTPPQDPRRRSVTVRVHSSCFTGEVLGSARCDCGEQLESAMAQMSSDGSGILVYLDQEGRGIGLVEKLKAYNLQDMGYNTMTANLELKHPADARDYTAAADILEDFSVDSIRLLTNNPDKIEKLRAAGVNVTERIPLVPHFDGLQQEDDEVFCLPPIASEQNSQRYGSVRISAKRKRYVSPELRAYLGTKVHFMNHMIDLREGSQ